VRGEQSGAQHAYAKVLVSGDSNDARVLTHALLDTGASRSAISDGVAALLGIEPIGHEMHYPVSGPVDCELYRADFHLGGEDPRTDPAVYHTSSLIVTGYHLEQQGMGAIIGMDVLSRGYFTVHGPLGLVTLAF
jgi:hypothetical protein